MTHAKLNPSDQAAHPSRLIVALDVSSFEEMKVIVETIGENVGIYKIGHQLFTAQGPKALVYLKEQKKAVFLDAKLHEIPNSVAAAVKEAAIHGVKMITVHASGGKKMMQAAVEAAKPFPDLHILALTVVTGLSDQDLREIGFTLSHEALVVHLAKLAKESGCHGVIASPKEVQLIREQLGNDLLVVTPGVRPADAAQDDQYRIATPKQAIQNGASYIVVGRPIVKANNPAEAAKAILAEMSG